MFDYAGNVSVIFFENLCGASTTVTVPFLGGQVLEPDDALNYILYENSNDPLGSILFQSASPVFSFNPNTMNFGQIYYLATIAGNVVNKLVNLNDPCLDISNMFAQAKWNQIPTVSLTASPTVCTGVCQDLEINFTGTPPFNLTCSTSAGGTQSQIFASNSGILQVCPPAGFSGNFQVQAVGGIDAHCACP